MSVFAQTSIEKSLDRRRGEKKTKAEVTVRGAIATEITNYNKLDMEKKSAEFMSGVLVFADTLSREMLRARQAAEGENTVTAVQIIAENGRKFDKMVMLVTRKVRKTKGGGFESKVTNEGVLYFVAHKNEAIYGVKSPVAPNLNHYYGTLKTLDKWDWSGARAEPFDAYDAGVVEIGAYGDFKRYVPGKNHEYAV